METSNLRFKKVLSLLKNPRVFLYSLVYHTGFLWSDKLYLKTIYRLIMGKKLNLENPISYNEKLQWLKLYNRRPEYTIMADKFAVKQYVAKRIGEEYVVENYMVCDSWEKIDFSKLPNQFVIKCTHDSGGAFVCKDKVSFNLEATKKIIKRNLRRNDYLSSREWPYKNIKPQIIVDRFLDDHTGKELRDYKWWCFNGKPTYMYCTIKGDNVYENFYDMDFKPVAIDHGFPRHQPEFEKPVNFELMKQLAAQLSDGIPFVRVDFFNVEGKVYFGEFTFFDWAGLRPFGGDWDKKLGELIVLPKLKEK